jgi:hypothetical protein
MGKGSVETVLSRLTLVGCPIQRRIAGVGWGVNDRRLTYRALRGLTQPV